MSTMVDYLNEYGELRPAPGWGVAVAEEVAGGPVLISWCDGEGSRLTVSLAVLTRIGSVPGYGPNDSVLHVGVEGYGSYGFAIMIEELHPAYVAEKFSRTPGRPVNPTWERFAEFLSEVRITLSGWGV